MELELFTSSSLALGSAKKEYFCKWSNFNFASVISDPKNPEYTFSPLLSQFHIQVAAILNPPF